MTLEQIRRKAQQDANRTGKRMAILNLNQFSPLYVIREWDDRFPNSKGFVTEVSPEQVS